MAILLAFSPFIVFVVIERLFNIPAGLVAGALMSAALIVMDLVKNKGKIKILEGGTFILFAGLSALSLWATSTPWSIAMVRLYVDGGLLLIVLVSLLIRHPFTLQYALEQSPNANPNSPLFLRTNYVISGVWAAAFAAMVLADILLVYAPDLPHTIAVTVTILALFFAFKFTQKYPEHVRNKAHPVAL